MAKLIYTATVVADPSVHVDEVNLFVFPVIVGGGKSGLPRDVQLDLVLLDERRFANGVVHMHHRTR
jgi:hypothetical protein